MIEARTFPQKETKSHLVATLGGRIFYAWIFAERRSVNRGWLVLLLSHPRATLVKDQEKKGPLQHTGLCFSIEYCNIFALFSAAGFCRRASGGLPSKGEDSLRR